MMTAAKKKTKNRIKKVWHVNRFRERYELPDNVRFDRKSPLLYTKDFVGSGTDDESCSYWRQLIALRSKTNWLALRGAFAELKNIAGNMSNVYRGYLLNNKFEPASVKEIGRWLCANEEQAKEILSELEDVGLMEQMNFPKFDTEDGVPAKRKSKKQKKTTKKITTKRKKASAKKSSTRACTGEFERARARTRNSVRARDSLKKKAKAKAKVKANVKDKAKNGSDKSPKEINNDKRYRGNSNALKGQAKEKGQTKGQTTSTPTTTPPFVPSESDAGGSVIPFHGPPGSANHNRSGPYYNPDAKEFGGIIYIALKLPWDPVSANGRRELGCFATAWQKAQLSGLSPQSLDSLWKKAIDVAHKIAKKRPSYRNPSRVWRGLFNKLLASKRSKTQCKTG